MGKLRTINHPGIEVQEIDMSGSTEQVGGCTTLVMGFFPQGESGKPVNPTTNASVKSYFGTPETEAERYAYYACKTVFDNGGNLVAARIPYNNNSQYLTPAVKYNIQEWATKHIKEYDKGIGARQVENQQTAEYSNTELSDSTTPQKSNFYYSGENFNGIGIYRQDVYSTKTYGSTAVVTTPTLAISSRYQDSSELKYYELSFNPFYVVSGFSGTSPDFQSYTLTALAYSDFQLNNVDIDGEVADYGELVDLDEDEAGVGSIYRVTNGFTEDEVGRYLNGTFAADSCFTRLMPFNISSPDTSASHFVDSRGFEAAALTARELSYDVIVYAFNGDEMSRDDAWADGEKAPYDTVSEKTNLPQTATVIPSSTEGDKRFEITYTDVYGNEKTDEIVNGRIFKVVASTDEYANGNGNYAAEFDDTASDGTVEITWASDNSDAGYFVYDRNADDWRPFYDYYDDVDSKWGYTPRNLYSYFRYNISDSTHLIDTGDQTVNSDNDTWTNVDGTIAGQPVTSVVYPSLADGSLRFKITNANGDVLRENVIQPIFHSNSISEDMDITWLNAANAQYFNIVEHEMEEWKSHVSTSDPGSYYYNESLVDADEKRNFCFQPTKSSPTTASVDAYTSAENGGMVSATAFKSYYRSGDGMVYPEMNSEDYYELRVWNSNKVKTLSDLTTENFEYFDVIHREYVGTESSDVYRIENKDFKAAPLSTDVTVGYEEDSRGVSSETLAITATDDFDYYKYQVIEDENPFGTGYMKVLKQLNPNSPNIYDPNDFFEFVSPYTEIKDVALAHSERYKWIHWYTPKTDETSTDNAILLSRTLGCEIADVPIQLSEVENLVTIVPDGDFNGYMPLSDFQDYRDEAKKVAPNTIVVANITEQKFASDMYNNAVVSDGESTAYDYSDEVLGIVPVLMGGFQSLPRQSRIELPEGITNAHIFNAIESIKRGSSIENDPAPADDHVDIKAITLNTDGYVRTLGTTGEYDAYESTYSNQLLSNIPSIDLNANYKPNGAKMNYVTLAVCQLSLSKVNDNKIALTVLETFTGSLDSTAKDDNGKSIFIDSVVNSEDSGSTYVRLFSNYQTTLNGSQTVSESKREFVSPASNDTKVTLAVPASCGTKLWWTNLKPSMSLGFTKEQTKKYISYATMVATMENVFDALSNVDELDLDLVVDAGLSTIANRVKKYCDEHPEETKMEYDVFYDKISSVQDVAGWKSMCAKMTTFCQTTRKDCISLLDAPRSLCVKDNVKLVQPGNKYSVDYDILPKFNYIGGMNSSYAAGYCDWLLAVDDFTSKNVWLPPSIAAEGAVIYTDYNSNYWMAPAGQSRGNVMWAVDVAFNPNSQQQDSIYSKGWNYAISSSGNIMVWGQKTMLNSTSSFNRINIRRLFCRLERLTRKNSKWVIFEINNQRTRDIYKDRIDPIFANVKAMGGIYDYQIICDERNNTPQVVMQNEFRSAFLIKPEYAAEYIILTFFNMNRDMDFSEAYSQL